MRSLICWLDEPWTGPSPFEMQPFGIPESPTRMQVYAAFISMGGRPGSGYGVISGGGLYGQTGLHQEEAYSYWELSAYINGWLTGTDNTEANELTRRLKAEWDRVKALRETDEARDRQLTH